MLRGPALTFSSSLVHQERSEEESGNPRIKGPLCSFTVNKQCLKSCLVFCSYGCYSSGRPAPWALGPSGPCCCHPSEAGPGSGLQIGLLACLLPPCPLLAGPRPLLDSPAPMMSPWEVVVFYPGILRSSLEAAMLTVIGTQKPLGPNTTTTTPAGQTFAPRIPPLCLHCHGGPTRIPDHARS